MAPTVGYQVAFSLSHSTHTCRHRHTHTHKAMSFVYILAKTGLPRARVASVPTIWVRLSGLVLPLVPFFLFLMPLRFVTFSFLVLSLFKCQLHSTFIQICVARICLDIARQYTPYILYIYIQFYILIKLNMCVISLAGCASPLRVKVSSSCDFQWIYRVLLCVSEGLGILPQIC